MIGRSTRIRTLDPLVPNQVRYQTAPHSELTWYYMRYEWDISRTICLFKKLFSFLYIRCKDFFFLLTLRCSNCCFIHWHIILLFGCGGRIRTADLQVMSLMSYYFSTPRYLGGGDRDRTCDLLLAKQPLSQLSYTP